MPSLRILFLIDPPESLDPPTDTSLALMQEAQRRGHEVSYGFIDGLAVDGARVMARAWSAVFAAPDRLSAGSELCLDLVRTDVVFMRKDPPVDLNYLHAVEILDLLPETVLQINPPSVLRRYGEKTIPLRFADLMPETVVSCRTDCLEGLFRRHERIVVKPLEDCSGRGVVLIEADDPERREKLRLATCSDRRFVQGQEFLPCIAGGDIRVLLLGGEILGSVRRVPTEGDFRSNVNAGGHCERCSLGDMERAICARLQPWLRDRAIHFAGVDIVGDKVLEVNVTSPSCLREINDLYGCALERKVLDYVETHVAGVVT